MTYNNLIIEWFYDTAENVDIPDPVVADLVKDYGLEDFGLEPCGEPKFGEVGDEISGPLKEITRIHQNIIIIVTGTTDTYGTDDCFREWYYKGEVYLGHTSIVINPPDSLTHQLGWIQSDKIQ